MHDHPSHWKYTITKYKIQVAVPTNTRVVLYAHPVKLFAHTHTQTLLLELLSFTDVDNNTALHLSYFPRDDIHPLTLHIRGHVPESLSSVILVHPANFPEC